MLSKISPQVCNANPFPRWQVGQGNTMFLGKLPGLARDIYARAARVGLSPNDLDSFARFCTLLAQSMPGPGGVSVGSIRFRN